MEKEVIENIAQVLQKYASKIIFLEARCDALACGLALLAKAKGIDDRELMKIVQEIQDASEQKRLEEIENKSPATAAGLDQRPSLPSIDESLLKRIHFHSS